MAKGITVDLIVDPKGAIKGIGQASDESNKFTGMLGKLGKIGGAAVAAVGAAAVTAATGLAAATVSAGKYADEILEASVKTNIAADTLQVYRYAAEQIDVSFETFTKSQGKFVQAMNKAADGTGPAAQAFDALGLSATDSAGNLLDSETVYWQAIDALGEVANETERTALAQQIFGKSGAELNAIIAQGSEGFAELRAQAEANGAVMSGPQLEALGAFDDKLQALTATTDAAKNALGLTLLPVLDQLAGDGTSALGSFTSALLEADGDLTKAGPAFEALGTNVASALTAAVPKVLEVGTSLISGLIEGIVSQGPSLIETAVPLLLTFVTGILGMLPAILDAGIKILIALVQGVAAALPVLIPAAVDAVIGLVGALVQNLPLLIDAGIQLVIGLALGLIDALPQLIEAIPTLVTGIIVALVAAIPQLILAGNQLFLALIKNLPAIISGIVGAVPAIIKGLVAAFTDPKFLKQMGTAGMELIHGLWQGIRETGDWLWRQISGFFGGQIDMIKDLLGIRSPSTVFAGIGRDMVRGLEVGLSAPNTLGSITSDLTRQVTSGFSGSLSVDARTAVSDGVGMGGGATIVQVTVPVTNSFVGNDDQLARKFESVMVNGLRNGTISMDWTQR